MSLATRCPACGTVFRVVQDQLRVSEGWVRCGRCSEVFNAVDHMVDLPRPSTPPQPASAPAALETNDPFGRSAQTQPAATDMLIESDHAHDMGMAAWNDPGPAEAVVDGGRFDESDESTRIFPAFRPQDGVADTAPAMPVEAAHGIDVDKSSADGVLSSGADETRQSPKAAVAAESSDIAPAVSGPETETETETGSDATASAAEAPTFLREAERAARWRQPAVRRALLAGVVLGMLLLGLQVAIEYRDLVAARWAGTRPALEQICRWADCRVEHPRIVDALVVDSSGLVRVDGTSTYRFSVVLRNRSPLTLAMPAIDLTLTDTQGRVISRRTLSAVELGVGASTVAAAAELPLQATLGIADRPVAGYTIEVFYP